MLKKQSDLYIYSALQHNELLGGEGGSPILSEGGSPILSEGGSVSSLTFYRSRNFFSLSKMEFQFSTSCISSSVRQLVFSENYYK